MSRLTAEVSKSIDILITPDPKIFPDSCIHTRYGETPMHGATTVHRILELYKAGLQIDAKTIYGWTPLHCAALNDRWDLIKILLHLGADRTAQTNDGDTPLSIASRDAKIYPKRFVITIHTLENYQPDPRVRFILAKGTAAEAIITTVNKLEQVNAAANSSATAETGASASDQSKIMLNSVPTSSSSTGTAAAGTGAGLPTILPSMPKVKNEANATGAPDPFKRKRAEEATTAVVAPTQLPTTAAITGSGVPTPLLMLSEAAAIVSTAPLQVATAANSGSVDSDSSTNNSQKRIKK